VKYKLVYTKQAQRDAKKVASSGLKDKVQHLLSILAQGLFQEYPPTIALVCNEGERE